VFYKFEVSDSASFGRILATSTLTEQSGGQTTYTPPGSVVSAVTRVAEVVTKTTLTFSGCTMPRSTELTACSPSKKVPDSSRKQPERWDSAFESTELTWFWTLGHRSHTL